MWPWPMMIGVIMLQQGPPAAGSGLNWWLVAVQTGVALLGASGLGAIITAVARRRNEQVDAEATLSDAALRYAQQLKTDAEAAQKVARECHTEVLAARRDMRRYRDEFNDLLDYATRLARLIRDPEATLAQLRRAAGSGPPNFPVDDPTRPDTVGDP